MKIRLSGQARAYIRAEAAYLRSRNRAAADAFLSRMSEARMTLSRFPDAGFLMETPPVTGVRRMIVGDYLLDYEPATNDLLILAIRHGAQKPAPQEPDDNFNYEA